MYNPNKITQLLEARGLKKKDLLAYLGKDIRLSLAQIIEGKIRVDKLEKIADFFGVPVDTFFDREVATNNSVTVSGVQNQVHNFTVGVTHENDTLKSLIAEKDKQIKLLEEMIILLKDRK